jgi:tetratricopeptide (TPR) repeat protein
MIPGDANRGWRPELDVKTRTTIAASLLLFLLVLAVFWQAASFGFISFDDPVYVTRNPHVTSGLSLESVKWAFTTFYGAYWHPLTWLSLMFDAELFGTDPRGFHRVNIAIHGLGTVLLFLFLYRATGSPWRSAIAAALFAIHPLRVESVVWITERKDVLATLFWMLTLLVYVGYARRPAPGRYVAVLAAFAAGLLAKPMAVTLPFVLLLLDYWPLDRLRRRTAWALVREKVPLLLIAAASAAVTLVATQRGGSVQSLESFTLVQRGANALVSYVAYIGKLLWPSKLALFYPHPLDRLALWQVAGALLLLAVLSAAAWRCRRDWPWVPVGWLWFLGTLVPVIGLVQVSDQAMSDRFTYVPHVGLIVLVVWSLARIFEQRRHGRLALGVASAVVLAALAAATWAQTRYWRDSETLLRRTLEVTGPNYVAHALLADHLIAAGRPAAALPELERAIEIRPDYTYPYLKLAGLYEQRGRVDEAERLYLRALDSEPENLALLNDYATLLSAQGRADEAIAHLRKVVELDPGRTAALSNLGLALARLERHDEAIRYYAMALEQRPDYAVAHLNLGISLFTTGRHEQAEASLRRAIELSPRLAQAHYFLIRTYIQMDEEPRGVAHFQQIAAFDEALAHEVARMLKLER